LYFQTLRFVKDDLFLKKYGKMIRRKQVTLLFKRCVLIKTFHFRVFFKKKSPLSQTATFEIQRLKCNVICFPRIIFPYFFKTQRLKSNVTCFRRIILPYFFKNKSSFTNRNVWKYIVMFTWLTIGSKKKIGVPRIFVKLI
jgi:hypothetical protein